MRLCLHGESGEGFTKSADYCFKHNYDFDSSLLAFMQPRECGNCKFWGERKETKT